MIELKEVNGKIEVSTPYNADFVAELKKRIGTKKWDASNRVWIISKDDKAELLEILKEVFGYTESQNSETCTVEIKLDGKVDKGAVIVNGILIAKAWGRDSGAKLGDGVTVIEGGFDSGGSRANWITDIDYDTIVRVKNFPVYGIDNPKTSEDVDIEWIRKVSDVKIDREKLLKEKQKLLDRLAEIEKLLEEE